MNPLDIRQGSDEWHEYRLGSVGSSGIAAALSFLKRSSESSKEREAYKLQKLAEITTGLIPQGYVSRAMQFGTDSEPLARMSYEERTGQEVRIVGIQPHPTIARAHASPDGYVDNNGAIELKCPESHTHLRYLKEQAIPEEYIPQCWWVLACSGREWLDFVSFDPRQSDQFKLFIKRLHRDEKIIADYDAAVTRLWSEIDADLAALQALYPPVAAPEAPQVDNQWDDAALLDMDAVDEWLANARPYEDADKSRAQEGM